VTGPRPRLAPPAAASSAGSRHPGPARPGSGAAARPGRRRSPAATTRTALPAGQVHEHVHGVHVGHGQVSAGVAQLPQVLPIEPVQVIGDEHPPVRPALDPDPVRVVAGHHLDERGVTAAGAPVAVLQPERFPQAKASLGKKRPQQAVPHPARPLPVHRIKPRARIADRLDLPGSEHRRRHVPRCPHPNHRPLPTLLTGHVLQHRLIDGPAAMYHPHQIAAQRDAVQLVEPVTGDHRPQPGADRRLGEPRRPQADRYHLRAVPAAQPRQEPAHIRQGQLTLRQAEHRQVGPPQRQGPRIGLHRVRRRALHPQVLQELLGQADHPVIGAQHHPRRRPARQHQPLRPALCVNFRHVL